jgi:DNA-binding NarL/FixJ family response regulator
VTPDTLPEAGREVSRITLVVVSDVRLYRDGIAAALARRDTISVVGAVSSVADALRLIGQTAPGVVVFDMATRDSLAGIRTLAANLPASKIVAFAVDDLESEIVSCAEAGVAGYVPCEASVDDLASTVESVSREESPCSPRVAATLFRRIATLAASLPGAGGGALLSNRERQILTLIRSGLSNKEIAQKLTIEVATVKNHVHSLLGKLGVTTRAEAAARQQTAGLRSRVTRRSIAGTLVFAVATAVMTGCAAQAERRYADDAHGQPAPVSDSWEIHGDEGAGIGAITSAVRVGDEMFLADRQARIRRYDLRYRKPLPDVGAGDDRVKLGRPWALAADEAGQFLFVVDGGLKSVFSFRLPSGAFHRQYALPRRFIPGRSAEYVPPGQLYMGGLWYPEMGPDWSFNDLAPEHFFDTLRFGVTLSLESGEVAERFTPYEARCMAGTSCAEVNLARVAKPAARWVVANGGSDRIGVYDDNGRQVTSLDITSPMFRRSGVVVKPRTSAKDHALWMRDNSEIDRVFVFGSVIATSHMVVVIPPDWSYGPLNYRVHLNLHAFDGGGIVSDIALPDRPVGHDEHNLYVVDYGKAGRQPRSSSIRLLQIPVKGGQNAFRSNPGSEPR